LLNEDGKLKPQAKANLQLMIAASQGNKKDLEEVVKKIKKLNLPLDNSL
jgi:ACT domain-containing protein